MKEIQLSENVNIQNILEFFSGPDLVSSERDSLGPPVRAYLCELR